MSAQAQAFETKFSQGRGRYYRDNDTQEREWALLIQHTNLNKVSASITKTTLEPKHKERI